MKVDFKISGVESTLATLKSLPPEIVSKRGGPVKLAVAKAARLIRDEAKRNLLAQIKDGVDDPSTGLLEKSVIASRGKAPSDGKGERYLVRVKRRPYPGRKPEKKGGVASTLKTAQIKEYGSKKQQATPWLRPAVRSKGELAIKVMRDDLLRRIDIIVRKQANANRGKK